MTDISAVDREQELGQAIASKLRGLRRDQGLTLDRVAKLTGFPRELLSRWSRGKRTPASVFLCRLAATRFVVCRGFAR
ncbi:helix-turn-helix transcriptional regulator [Mesorhizobium sp. M1399]|uniref:helix-turn-helix domain-containing protein n=1 Tax=Mesorhizobium sp. M1399 TaxID=2957096 RepID=UPI003334D21C